MSATALILVIVGLSLMLSRGPLLVAPVKTRDTYLRLFETERRMRVLGLVFGAISALVAWSVWEEPGTTAQVIAYFALFILVLPAGSMILFPGPMQKLATNIWNAFGEKTMRVMGLLSLAFGAWLVYFGLGL